MEIFSGKRFSVIEQNKWQYMSHPGGAAILPILNETQIILVKQQRPPVSTTTIEVPAGTLDIEHEEPAVCAARELEEETGYTASHIEKAGFIYSSPGVSNERIYLFIGMGLKLGNKKDVDNEQTDVIIMDIEEALKEIGATIFDAKTIVLLQRHQLQGLKPQ